MLFSIFTLLSCKKDGERQFLKAFGTWKIERFVYSKGTLLINDNHTFNFEETGELSKTKSVGNWKIKEDTLILTSVMPKECFYVMQFSPYCEDKNIVIKPYIESTIKDCEPKDFAEFYTKFNDEKFLFRNDSLIYINENKNCANKQYPYKIFR